MTVQTAPLKGAVGLARASVDALRVLAQLRREARTVATESERAFLAGWSGWGPLAPMFAPSNATWEAIADDVRDLLPEADVEIGERGTYNAFFTPMPVVRGMWQILAELGFTGGPVLEPGCGSGRFAGEAPDGVVVTGVERDPTSAAIARLLHPDHMIVRSALQDAQIGSGFAAAIGNVPFGKVPVFDPSAPDAVRGNLHNYFIWRAVNALAPGGVAVLLTSRYMMDAFGSNAREEIQHVADFIGAVRLPNGGLDEGGTKVFADIVALRRRVPGEHPLERPWLESRYDDDLNTYVNEWWAHAPHLVLGTVTRGKTSQYGHTLQVSAPDDAPPMERRLVTAGGSLASMARGLHCMWTPPADVTRMTSPAESLDAKGWYEGSFHFDGAKVVKVEDGKVRNVAKPGAELLALMKLRDLAVTLVGLEADHNLADDRIEPTRRACAAAYTAYVRRFKALNRSTLVTGPVDDDTGLPTYSRRLPSMGGFRSDPDWALVAALEVYDDDTGDARPAPILSSRQNMPTVRPTRTDDPEQALAWTLDRLGRADIQYIAGLLRVDPETVPPLLGDRVFLDPQTRVWLAADEYLSGDVRTKRRVAKVAAAADPQFERNVTALRKVVPKWLGPGEITANLGAPWIGTGDVRRFMHDTFGGWAGISRIEATGQWEVDITSGYREDPRAAHTYGTPDMDGYQLTHLALNGKVPTVYRTHYVNGKETRRKDADASLLAVTKQQLIRARFSEWVWEDAERTARLTRLYNERYNNLAPRRFDGTHVTVDGMAPGFVPYAHQREFVARAVGTPASLCGHPVGAGKTASMAMTVMKMRQVGLARKPALVVPNHLKEQVERETRQLFPGAKILTAPTASTAATRRSFAARCATGDWDLVIFTHSAFDRIAVAPDTEMTYLQEQVDAMRASILAACPDGKFKGRIVKQAARSLDALVERIRELRDRAHGHDLGVTFEQLGIDYVCIDEAHYYKNLSVPCRTEGFSVRPSKRATHLDVILGWLSQRGSGRYAALFTGTPVSNTMLELYVVLHYLMPGYMREIGMGSADPWAAAFVQFVTTVDVTVDGGNFQLKTRPALFVNAPELRMLLSQVADIRTAEQLGLPRPDVDVRTIVCAPTTVQRLISMSLVKRTEAVSGKTRFAEGDDNMLAICGDGRRAATDPVLAGYNDPEDGKLHRVAAEILQVWRDNPDELQIAFCDVGTPNDKKGPQTYGRLRRMLTDGGMPVGRIRFIHDAKTDAAKAQLFKECRTGQVSVVIGSTDKLGVGTNIQDRVVAMHHVDAPFRPADVNQRDGRGRRPGNRHAVVLVFRYVTERTFDAYMWQMLVRKLTFIEQITSGNLDRTVEDVGSDELTSATAVKAAATGQPLLQEQAKVRADVNKLQGVQRNHVASQRQLRQDVPLLESGAEANDVDAAAWEAIAAACHADDITEEHGQALLEQAQQYRYPWRQKPVTIGTLTVRFETWANTSARDVEYHPSMIVSGGAGDMTKRAFKHWDADSYRRELRRMVRSAASDAATLRAGAQRKRDQAARSKELLGQPFGQAEELATALARLTEIEAELQAAAAVKSTAGDGDGASLDLSMLAEYRIDPVDEGGDLEDPAMAFMNDLVTALEAEIEAALQGLFEAAAAVAVEN